MEYLEAILRSTVVIIAIMILIRVLGKKELGQLSIFDLVVLLVIADIGSIAIENNDKLYSTILVFLVVFLLQKLFSWLLLHFTFLRGIFDGEPAIIIKDGKLDLRTMKKEMYTVDDLINQMRVSSVMDIKDIKLAILETSGDLSVFSYSDNKQIILPVIISGRICKKMLKHLNLDQNKIKQMCQQKSLRIKDIYYASSNGKELFISISAN